MLQITNYECKRSSTVNISSGCFSGTVKELIVFLSGVLRNSYIFMLTILLIMSASLSLIPSWHDYFVCLFGHWNFVFTWLFLTWTIIIFKGKKHTLFILSLCKNNWKLVYVLLIELCFCNINLIFAVGQCFQIKIEQTYSALLYDVWKYLQVQKTAVCQPVQIDLWSIAGGCLSLIVIFGQLLLLWLIPILINVWS